MLISTRRKKYYQNKKNIKKLKVLIYLFFLVGEGGGERGYENSQEKVVSLCIMLPIMIAYRGDFDETKYMSFLIKVNELLEKYEKN